MLEFPVKIERIFPDLYRARFEKLYNLSMSFVRLQEYYDDSMFHGRLLEIEDFIEEWSLRRGNGEFTYPENWNGYGVRGKNIMTWLSAVSGRSELRKEEEDLFNKLLKVHGSNDFTPVYLFGVCETEGIPERVAVTNHEIAHYLFYKNKRYKQKVKGVLSHFPGNVRLKFENILQKKYYHRTTFVDEIQANIATSENGGLFDENKLKIHSKYGYLYKKLREIYSHYKKELFDHHPNQTLEEELRSL